LKKITIDDFRIVSEDMGVYAIGLADNLVTIRSQQVRAICFADLLHENTDLSARSSVAILGGGIAGLTVAARLLQRGWTDLVIYERLPELLCIQNGCDTRWIHPKIISWPYQGCREKEAGLPILNWTSSTASDVTYQIEKQWEKIISGFGTGNSGKPVRKISVMLGVTFLRVSIPPMLNSGKLRSKNIASVEWIRDTRVEHKKIQGDLAAPSGIKGFRNLVFATGFGIEKSARDSYWRNESLGQIRLDGVQQRYLVSGFGDGAVTDIVRLIVRNFRPDRILDELTLSDLELYLQRKKLSSIVECLDGLYASKGRNPAKLQLIALIDYFKKSRRDDTYVVHHIKGQKGFIRSLSDSPASILNKVFMYALYKIGGFQYVESRDFGEECDVAKAYEIPDVNIIRRHGVNRLEILGELLPDSRLIKAEKTGNRGRPRKGVPLIGIEVKSQPIDQCESRVLLSSLCAVFNNLAAKKGGKSYLPNNFSI